MIEYIFVIIAGLGMGSCATMPYYRLPNGQPCAGKWVGKKSHCTSCNHQLRTRDLVPIFNWLLTGGKCKFCGYKINPVYFFIELGVTISSVVIYSHYGLDNLNYYMIILGLAMCGVILCATEYSYRNVPDQVIIAIIMLGFLYNSPASMVDMLHVFFAGLILSLLYIKIYNIARGQEIPSYGHAKLFAVTAFWLPYGQFFIHTLSCIILGYFVYLLTILFGDKQKTIPLTYAIILSILMNILYPEWYMI